MGHKSLHIPSYPTAHHSKIHIKGGRYGLEGMVEPHSYTHNYYWCINWLSYLCFRHYEALNLRIHGMPIPMLLIYQKPPQLLNFYASGTSD